MKARKEISLDELFRLYPQLRLAAQQEVKHGTAGQGGIASLASEEPVDSAGELAEA